MEHESAIRCDIYWMKEMRSHACVSFHHSAGFSLCACGSSMLVQGSISSLNPTQCKGSLISKQHRRQLSDSKAYSFFSCLTFMTLFQGQLVGSATDLPSTLHPIPQEGLRRIVLCEGKCFSWQPQWKLLRWNRAVLYS